MRAFVLLTLAALPSPARAAVENRLVLSEPAPLIAASMAGQAPLALAAGIAEPVSPVLAAGIAEPVPPVLAAAIAEPVSPIIAASEAPATFSLPAAPRGARPVDAKGQLAAQSRDAAEAVSGFDGGEALAEEPLKGDRELDAALDRYVTSVRPVDLERAGVEPKLLARAAAAMIDKVGYRAWARRLQREIAGRMADNRAAIDGRTLRRSFLRTAREKLGAAGFSTFPGKTARVGWSGYATKEGFVELGEIIDEEYFLSLIKAGHVPIDAASASARNGFQYHGSLSHMIQTLYLLDAIGPDFARFYRQMTRPIDGKTVWHFLMDNRQARSLSNPAVIHMASGAQFGAQNYQKDVPWL